MKTEKEMVRRIKLAFCLRELGFKPNWALYQDRAATQAIAYLLQKSGVKLGYKFAVTVRGPYSNQLVQDMRIIQHNAEVNKK